MNRIAILILAMLCVYSCANTGNVSAAFVNSYLISPENRKTEHEKVVKLKELDKKVESDRKKLEMKLRKMFLKEFLRRINPVFIGK
jgi:hypothetical protein